MSGADTPVAKFFINCLAEEPKEARGRGWAQRCRVFSAAHAAHPCVRRLTQHACMLTPSCAPPPPPPGGQVPGAARAPRAAGEPHARGRHQQHGARTREGGRMSTACMRAGGARASPMQPRMAAPHTPPPLSTPPPPPAVHPVPDQAQGLRPDPEAPGAGGAQEQVCAGGGALPLTERCAAVRRCAHAAAERAGLCRHVVALGGVCL